MNLQAVERRRLADALAESETARAELEARVSHASILEKERLAMEQALATEQKGRLELRGELEGRCAQLEGAMKEVNLRQGGRRIPPSEGRRVRGGAGGQGE